MLNCKEEIYFPSQLEEESTFPMPFPGKKRREGKKIWRGMKQEGKYSRSYINHLRTGFEKEKAGRGSCGVGGLEEEKNASTGRKKNLLCVQKKRGAGTDPRSTQGEKTGKWKGRMD